MNRDDKFTMYLLGNNDMSDNIAFSDEILFLSLLLYNDPK